VIGRIIWAAVAGRLDLDGVSRTGSLRLQVTDDGRIALLARMVALGAVGEAITQLRETGTHWLSAQDGRSAGSSGPPPFLSALAGRCRRASSQGRILARSAIAGLLAAERVGEIISDADRLNAADRCSA
jgi:hypothetical protein